MKKNNKTIKKDRLFIGMLIALTILLGSLLVTFKLYGPYVNPKTYTICFGVAACLLTYLIVYPIQRSKTVLNMAMFWGVISYSLALIVTSMTSIDPTVSWLGLPIRATSTFLLLILSIFALLIGTSLSKEQVRKYVFLPISISGTIIALSVYIERWDVSFLASASHGGLLGNTSYVGTYVIFSFFITAYLFFTSSSKNKKFLYLCLALVSILNPIFINFSFSAKNGIFDLVGDARAAAVSIVIGSVIGLFIWLATSSKRISKIVGKSGIVASGAAVLFLLLQLLSSNSSLHNWFIQKASDTRFIYWNIALQGFHDSSIVGSGPETYVYTYQEHFNPDMYLAKNNMEVWSDKPHNVYLEILSTSGIVGLIGYMALIGTLLYSIYLGYRKHDDRFYAVTMYSLVAAYLINNIVIFDTPTSYLALFCLIGAAIAHAKKDEVIAPYVLEYKQKIYQGIIGTAVFVVVCFFMIPSMFKMYMENTDFSLVLQDKIAWYPKTEKVSSYGSAINLAERSGQLYEDQLQPNLNSIVNETPQNKEITVNLIDSLVATMQGLFKKYPENVQGLINIGRVESIKMAIRNKTDEQSLAIMTHAATESIRLAPQNPAGYWLLGQVYTYEGKFDDAFNEFEIARSIDPAIADSHNNLIRLAKYLNDQKKVAFYTQRAKTESTDFVNGVSSVN